MSYFDTRRGQIVVERAKEQIKFVLFVVLTLALIITSAASCVKCGGCGSDDDTPEETEQAETESGEQTVEYDSLENVDTYPRLVNNDHLLGEDYEPPELTYLRGIPDGTSIQLNFDAATAFTKLYNGMLEDGLGIIPLSGYRTYQEQYNIFTWNIELHKAEGMTEEEALEYTKRFVALPGSSEHQYGRSIDVTIDGTTNHSFQKTEQGMWLIEHAHEYGFILRYPEDKVDITGIDYEPWHLRYVGVEAAEYIHKYNLCLEEYVELVRKSNPFAQSEQ